MPKQYYNVKHYKSQRSVGYLLRRAGKLITSQIETLFVTKDLSFVQWVIMMNLRDGLRMTAAELSQHLCHDSGALTRVIDQMEERGWIERKRSTEDRRVVSLGLTKAGLKVTQDFLPRVVELYNGLLEDFTEEESNVMVDLLTRLIAKMDDRQSKAGG